MNSCEHGWKYACMRNAGYQLEYKQWKQQHVQSTREMIHEMDARYDFTLEAACVQCNPYIGLSITGCRGACPLTVPREQHMKIIRH